MTASAAQTSYFSNVRPEVAALLPTRPAHVLEIGCGEGRFSAQVKQRDSYWGVEPSTAAAEKARAVLDRVIVGTYDQAESELPDRHFDLVICNDVMEHMVDHDAFLDAIKRKMAPGGQMIGSVPNVRYLPHLWQVIFGKDWRYESEGVLDRTHLRFFTDSSLRRAFFNHGYKVEKVVGLNSVIADSPWPGRLRWATTMRLLQLLTFRGQSDSQFMQLGFVVRP
jgi:2-polyprenyl-3-methyl-5-hydroxy-6-metoxy-1,4-benzoquinol methylase